MAETKTAQITWEAAQRLIEAGQLTRDMIFDRVADGSMAPDVARKCSEHFAAREGDASLVLRKTDFGLFVKADSWPDAWSKAKNKAYRYSLNMPWGVAKALFSDADTLKKIVDFVASTK